MKPFSVLLLLLLAYNASLAQTNHSKNNSALPIKFYVGAGAAINSFAVTGDKSYHETQIEHAVPTSPAFVVGARFYTDNKASRFFLAPRISVYSFSAKCKVDLTSGVAKYNHASSYKSSSLLHPPAAWAIIL